MAHGYIGHHHRPTWWHTNSRPHTSMVDNSDDEFHNRNMLGLHGPISLKIPPVYLHSCRIWTHYTVVRDKHHHNKEQENRSDMPETWPRSPSHGPNSAWHIIAPYTPRVIRLINHLDKHPSTRSQIIANSKTIIYHTISRISGFFLDPRVKTKGPRRIVLDDASKKVNGIPACFSLADFYQGLNGDFSSEASTLYKSSRSTMSCNPT
jgi:hypothetical protein